MGHTWLKAGQKYGVMSYTFYFVEIGSNFLLVGSIPMKRE
ncbi:hypothetical protein GFK82_00158 [Candidatus Steffania adelgidicola]|nr:hypothetical protein GFK82_00158 [Candidatus Steffania adelgidicola]